MDDATQFVIYDKTHTFQKKVVPGSSTTVLPANAIPTSSFELDSDHPALGLLTPGARCGFRFRGIEWYRGRVMATHGTGPVNGKTTVSVQGDFRKFWEWQGWQKPTANLLTQTTVDVEYARYTGTTEAVWRAALVANLTRLGVPWTVAASQGRGKPGRRVEFRNHPLADKLIPLLDDDDLIATLAYGAGAAVAVSLRSAVTLPNPLSELTGVLEDYEWDADFPSATRVVVGGSGEGVARSFLQKVNHALEADWGDIIETFRDSRMADEGANLTTDADEALAEGVPTVGIRMDLQESDRFRFGDTFLVGDRVPVKLRGFANPITERISQVQIDETPEQGVVVTPRLGSIENSPDAELAARVAALARGVRDQGRR